MERKLKKSSKSKLSLEDIDFLEQEAMHGKPVCLYGEIQRIEKTCAALRDYNLVRDYLKSLRDYDKKNSSK